MILFLALIGYLIYFDAIKAETIINHPANRRAEAFAERIIRGDIIDRNGTVLATTTVAEDGSEYRNYPFSNAFAHAIGFSSTGIPRTGVENIMNFELLTSNAFFVERFLNEFRNIKNQGNTIMTTIDARLQNSAAQALGNNRGAIVAIDYTTGQILAMVSNPGFDPNIIGQNWSDLNADEANSPLLNRATQGLYAPGSVFKTLTALEYIRENPDYTSFTFHCTGSITIDGVTINCAGGRAHGTVDLRQAYAVSCNSAFIQLGMTLNTDRFVDTVNSFLFNQTPPSPLNASATRFPLSSSDPTSERMMTYIGQGRTMTSPYHMTLITAAIANGGMLMNPYIVDSILTYNNHTVRSFHPEEFEQLLPASDASILQDFMRAVVTDGTAQVLRSDAFTVAGKTGTAQYSTADGTRTHSWFTGYTTMNDLSFAFTILVEGQDSDATLRAANLAQSMLQGFQ